MSEHFGLQHGSKVSAACFTPSTSFCSQSPGDLGGVTLEDELGSGPQSELVEVVFFLSFSRATGMIEVSRGGQL